jgi:hypothetical protein
MATIREMRERWQAVNVTEAAKDGLAEHSQEVVGLLQSQLYQSGLDGDNNSTPSYSVASVASGYVAEKNNPRLTDNPYGGYDYNDTGGYYNGMYLKLDNVAMEIDSSDSKTALFPVETRRLDTVSKNGLRKNILQPAMVQQIAQQTGCGTG